MGSQDTHAGSGLQRARIAARMTLAQVAAAVTRDSATVRRWEAGRTMPRQSTMLALAALYGCPVEELVD